MIESILRSSVGLGATRIDKTTKWVKPCRTDESMENRETKKPQKSW
jgi:hypothetical protein